MAAPKKTDPDAKVTLVCRYVKGRYPKLVTDNFPNGLKFRNAVIDITHADLVQLENHRLAKPLFMKGEIRILGKNTPIPKTSTPKVVTKRPISTQENMSSAASIPAGGTSSDEVDNFLPDPGANLDTQRQ